MFPASDRGCLRRHHIRATALGDRVRFGILYSNDASDIEAVVQALR